MALEFGCSCARWARQICTTSKGAKGTKWKRQAETAELFAFCRRDWATRPISLTPTRLFAQGVDLTREMVIAHL